VIGEIYQAISLLIRAIHEYLYFAHLSHQELFAVVSLFRKKEFELGIQAMTPVISSHAKFGREEISDKTNPILSSPLAGYRLALCPSHFHFNLLNLYLDT
jgi:hypothetical protein